MCVCVYIYMIKNMPLLTKRNNVIRVTSKRDYKPSNNLPQQ